MILPLIALAVSQSPLALEAQSVTITRDTFGIPHIKSKTDRGVAFGLIYAQAEDNYHQVELDTASAIGRESEIVGQRGLGNDLRFRAFEIENLVKGALASASPQFQSVAQGYADGLNFYLEKHPDLKTIITHYEPWFFMANESYPSRANGIGGRFGTPVDPADESLNATIAEPPNLTDTEGSNGWAIAPSRIRSGHAILFINPHVSLFGGGLRYECQIHSDEGWDFSGFCILGLPIPHTGFNHHLGWTHTNSGANIADAYRLQITGDTYKYGNEQRPIITWEDSVPVLENGALVGHKFRFQKTHLGPIVYQDGAPYSLCLPMDRWVKFFPQKFAMSQAKNLKEFERAMSIGAITASNTTYADDRGHIAFFYGNTMPRRNPALDYTEPLDGTDPSTAWQGYLSLDEVPHVIDPPSGFVQNCNSDPWHTTVGDGNPDPAKYPSYIVRDTDTTRAANSRRILGGTNKFSYEDLTALSFDTKIYTGITGLPILIQAIEADPATAQKYSGPLNALKSWDGRSSVDSSATTVFLETETLAATPGRRLRMSDDPATLRSAFTDLVDELTTRWGTWDVPWGKVNRMSRHQPFSPDFPSWPCAGANSSFGQIFAFSGPKVNGIHYGTVGDSYVALVEFGKSVRASAICGFGQSADPASPHYEDQAPLYAAGKFRPVWITDREVQAHAERAYHPGD